MHFQNVVGTGRYTTSTTNMYNKDFTYHRSLHQGPDIPDADVFVKFRVQSCFFSKFPNATDIIEQSQSHIYKTSFRTRKTRKTRKTETKGNVTWQKRRRTGRVVVGQEGARVFDPVGT